MLMRKNVKQLTSAKIRLFVSTSAIPVQSAGLDPLFSLAQHALGRNENTETIITNVEESWSGFVFFLRCWACNPEFLF